MKKKFLAICGAGIGSSVLLKMLVDNACQKYSIDAEIENGDMSAARGDVDVIFTSLAFAEDLMDRFPDVPVISVKNYVDNEEMEGYFRDLGLVDS